MIDHNVFKRQASLTYLKGKYLHSLPDGTTNVDEDSELDILLFYVNNSYKIVPVVFDVKNEKIIFPEFIESIVDDLIEVHVNLINDIKDYKKEYLLDSQKFRIIGDYVKELTEAKYMLLSEDTVNGFLEKDKESGKNRFFVENGYEYKLIKKDIASISSTRMTRGLENYELHPDRIDTSAYKDYEISALEEYIVKSTLDGKEHYTLLTGEPGTGKSTIAKVVAEKEQIPVYQMQFSNGTDEEGALCGVIPNTEDPKGTPWLRKESVLLFAMRHGGLVILDEINKAPTLMTSALNSILDDNASYTTDTGEVVHLHKDFRLIATMNPKVENIVNDSTVNRFRVFRIGSLSDEQLKSRLMVQLPELKDNSEIAEIMIKHYNKINSELSAQGKITNTPRNLLSLASSILELGSLGYKITETRVQNIYRCNFIDWLDVNYIADNNEYDKLYSLSDTLGKELYKKVIVQEKEDKDLGITISLNTNYNKNLEELQRIEESLREELKMK